MAGSSSPQKRIFEGVIIDARSTKRRDASLGGPTSSTPPPAKRAKLEEDGPRGGSSSKNGNGTTSTSTRSHRSDAAALQPAHEALSSSRSGAARMGGSSSSATRQGKGQRIDIPTQGAFWDAARLSSPTTHDASPTRSSQRPSPSPASALRVLRDGSSTAVRQSSSRNFPTRASPSHAAENDDEEDELTIPVSGSSSSRKLPARLQPASGALHSSTSRKGKERATATEAGSEHRRERDAAPPSLLRSGQKPPAFTLPGHRTSSRKKAAISDLLNRTTASIVSTGMEEEPPAQQSGPSRPGRGKSPTPAMVEMGPESRLPESPDLMAMPAASREKIPAARLSPARLEGSSIKQTNGKLPCGLHSVPKKVDDDGPGATDSPLSESEKDLESRDLPAPLQIDRDRAEDDSRPGPSLATPTKKAIPSRLSTPSTSAKKRTPTKAAKATESAANGETHFADILAPSGSGISQPARPALEIAGSSTTVRQQEPRPERLHRKGDAIRVLDRVLERLSEPCSTVYTPTSAPGPHDSAYRPWLAARACMSAGHEAAEKDVRNTLDRTVREGEGNCLLLVGERGIGKTAIVNRSLKTLADVYGEDGMLVVRLSGLVQRDDKGALKEVARQLCSSAYVDDADAEGGSSFTSNANILSSLLAILEPGPTDDAEEASARSKPLIFIIDEFDLFAHHSVRQSFLYCLLDCIQGGFRRGGMAVLGLSARADCIETLEKRVKSRCQSRVHHLLPAEDVLTGVAKTAKDAMTLNTLDVASPVEADWNEGIELFFSDKAVQVQLSGMDELRGLDADRKLFSDLAMLVANLRRKINSSSESSVTTSSLAIQVQDLSPCIQLPERTVPAGLGMPEVAMLISAKHLVEEERPCNFVVAYERYTDHCKRAAASGASSSRAFSRGLCLKAFEKLRLLGLIKDVAASARGGSVGGGSIFRLCRLVPWSSMIEEAVKERKDIPQHLVKWSKAWSD